MVGLVKMTETMKKPLSVYFSDKEKKKVQRAAEKSFLDTSSFIRSKILSIITKEVSVD